MPVAMVSKASTIISGDVAKSRKRVKAAVRLSWENKHRDMTVTMLGVISKTGHIMHKRLSDWLELCRSAGMGA